MAQSPLKNPEYKPSFSGHETFPLRYGWLQKAYEAVNTTEDGEASVRIFRDPSSIARFGVGRNMVGSMRHWATATNILSDDKDDGLCPTAIGDLLFGKSGVDPYLEEDGSLWLIHWHLASSSEQTSFYWLFNEYIGGSFSRREIVQPLMKLAEDQGWPRVAETTVDRDVQCLLRTYVGGRGESEAGDSILSELGLIRPLSQGRFALARGQKPSLPDEVFLFAVWEYWQKTAPEATTLSYEAVAFDGGAPGRALLLDESSLVERLEALATVSQGALEWSETAGLRQLVRRSDLNKVDVYGALRNALAPEVEVQAA